MENYLNNLDYTQTLPRFIRKLKPHVHGDLPYTTQMECVVDLAEWFEIIKEYTVVQAFHGDKVYIQPFVDFFKSDFPALETKELMDVMTVVRTVNEERVSAMTAQFLRVTTKHGNHHPFITLCMVSNLRTAGEHRGKGYASNLLSSVAMCLLEYTEVNFVS